MKSKWNYEITIDWSDADQASIVKVRRFNYKQALGNVEVIIREWIDTAKELNHPIPEPKVG